MVKAAGHVCLTLTLFKSYLAAYDYSDFLLKHTTLFDVMKVKGPVDRFLLAIKLIYFRLGAL